MLILASASPRRHELLLAGGIEHIVRPSHVPEDMLPGEDPIAFVRRISQQKADAIYFDPADTVLAADTVVCLENVVFGKPRDDSDAKRMLRALAGRDHWVHTGICIRTSVRTVNDVASTKVAFSPLTELEIAEYTRSGEPRDKAGAYAIQGLASKFVLGIEGCYHNVVGLPVSLVYRHLNNL